MDYIPVWAVDDLDPDKVRDAGNRLPPTEFMDRYEPSRTKDASLFDQVQSGVIEPYELDGDIYFVQPETTWGDMWSGVDW